jgi:hypothetical protein
MKTKNMTTLHLNHSINRSPLRLGFLLIPLLLGCFALSQTAQAVLPPDGGSPGDNTAEGTQALFSLTTGVSNTAMGTGALFSITTGESNTAIGARALEFNSGNFNTATGGGALLRNTAGTQNTATGTFALENNTTATNNTATGFQALFFNTSGTQNTATGESALKSNTTASNNTGAGFQVAFHNTTGAGNTAIGEHALLNNSTGSSNIALGLNAGSNLTTGDNNIDIGNGGVAGESDKIRIGTVGTQNATFVAGIHGVGVTGTAVVVGSNGQLGVAPSSARFKDQIKPMDKASEAILALKPVAFRYKKEIDPAGTPQFGLVAEEVDKVNPDLVVRDKEGKPYTVRYESVNAMLLNEFLKEHWTVQEQQKEIDALKAELKEQKALIQKVGDRVELNRAAPQTVLNNQ